MGRNGGRFGRSAQSGCRFPRSDSLKKSALGESYIQWNRARGTDGGNMMLEPLDRCRRDSTLFQFTTKQLRDFIDPNHLLIDR